MTGVQGRMIDRYGQTVEVIALNRGDGHGARPWIRVSWRGVLLGPGTTPGPGQGYYRTVAAALARVDVESLVEISALPLRRAE
jgi:hypothetical protein